MSKYIVQTVWLPTLAFCCSFFAFGRLAPSKSVGVTTIVTRCRCSNPELQELSLFYGK